MATTDVTQKSLIYHTLSELNTAFAAIVGHCDALQQTGLFKSKASKLLPSFVQELQAECNQEFLETVDAAHPKRHWHAANLWRSFLTSAPHRTRCPHS